VSWIVNWDGVDYDVDPTEFSGGELKLIKERTGLTFKKLTEALGELDGEAICALFWIAKRRTQPDLKFADFDGPPLKLFLANLDGFHAAMDELGKAMGMPETPETSGSESSPSTPDGHEPSTTD
jgi:hypothetical protein